MKRCIVSLVIILGLALTIQAQDDHQSTVTGNSNILEKGYRAAYRLYEDCQQRNVGVSVCLKKKAIAFFDRIGKIDNLPIAENLELVKNPNNQEEQDDHQQQNDQALNHDIKNYTEIEATLGRTTGASRDEILNEILLDRIATLMNGFNVQIKLPKTSATELARSMEEGRGKMKKMMNMMMMGMAMKMAAMVPIMMMVLFLLAGKALIISKIALVLSMIIGLKKLLGQKQSGGSDHGWQSGGGGGGGGWDRSLKGFLGDYQMNDKEREYALRKAYAGQRRR